MIADARSGPVNTHEEVLAWMRGDATADELTEWAHKRQARRQRMRALGNGIGDDQRVLLIRLGDERPHVGD